MRRELTLEKLVDRWILVFVLDLGPTQLDAHVRGATLKRAALLVVQPGEPQSEIARRIRSRIEVLVKPVLGWHDHGAGSPIALLAALVALAPQEREPDAVEDDHVRARSMAVRL